MPVVFIYKGYRFFFYSNEGMPREPLHVHVRRGEAIAKFWLDPVSLERAGGFKPHELNTIGKLVRENHDLLLERWHEYFGG